MKTLVTGGAGFIGSHIVDGLLKAGHRVRVIDNLSTGSKENLRDAWSRIEFIKGDICRPRDLQRAVKGVDVVFHEAALRSVPRSVEDPLSTHMANTTGSLLLLMACRKAKVRRLVYASSSSVYGDNTERFPQQESMCASPISPYAVAKYCAEMYSVVYSKTFGFETVSLRYFNVFGPRQSPTSQYAAVIPQFMQSAYHNKPLEIHWDGKQSRDFSYIDNVVHANLLAATTRGISGRVFNIACGTTHSILDVIHILEKLAGHPLKIKKFPRRKADVRKTWADIKGARQMLGYRPLVELEEGLRRSWEWYLSTL